MENFTIFEDVCPIETWGFSNVMLVFRGVYLNWDLFTVLNRGLPKHAPVSGEFVKSPKGTNIVANEMVGIFVHLEMSCHPGIVTIASWEGIYIPSIKYHKY